MTTKSSFTSALLQHLAEVRESRGVSQADIEKKLVIAPGWMERFETAASIPAVDTLFAILKSMDSSFAELFDSWAPPKELEALMVQRQISAHPEGPDLRISFRYANHDATYLLTNASGDQFKKVLESLKDAVGTTDDSALVSDGLADVFLKAMAVWPNANPSDIWYFVLSRAYCDPFNHHARYARKDFGQSWKRTAGWALEKVLVQHYGPFLEKHGINLLTGTLAGKRRILVDLGIKDRLEPAKVDLILTSKVDGAIEFFGVVHVKASFAERRTDDVPMSRSLIKSGFSSPLVTLDCKSMPSAMPVNRGELGKVLQRRPTRDLRSAKRKDIESDGYFSACFSYNSNTIPTPVWQKAKARINCCNFQNSNDAFSQFILGERERILAPVHGK